MIGVPLLLAVLPAQAQDTVTLPPIVTVARHAGAQMRLPLATTSLVVGPAGIPTGRSLADLFAFAPGLTARDRGNPSRDDAIAVRGVGARASFGVRGVRVLLDGVPQTLPDGQTQLSAVDPSTIERIEVLRGAASALYGNSAGGAVLLRTAPPAIAGSAAELRMDGRGGGRLGLQQTITDGAFGLRASAAYERGSGWRRHAGFETWRGALALAAHGPTARMTVHATFTHQPRLEDPGALTAAELAADPRAANPLFLQADARKRVTHVQGGIAGRQETGWGSLEGALWMQARSLRNPLPFVDISLGRVALGARFGAERRAGRGVVLAAGFDVQTMRDDRLNRDPATAEPVRDQTEQAAELAPWVHARWRPRPQVLVLLTGRWDAVRFSVGDHLTSGGDDSDTRVLSAPSISAGVTFLPHPAFTPWVGVATLFETPTITELTVTQATGGFGFSRALEPERGVQLEAGVRGSAAAVRWEVVAWRTGVANGLIPFESPDEPGRILYRNAGRLTRRGLEGSVGAAPLPVLEVDVAGAVSDLRYDTFSTPDGTFDGNRVPGVPLRRLAVRARFGTDAGWFAAEWQASSRMPVNDANSAEAAGWSLFHLRVGGTRGVAGARVRGWVALENVLDVRHVSAVQVNANAGRYYEPGAGRQVAVALSVSPGATGRDSSAGRSLR